MDIYREYFSIIFYAIHFRIEAIPLTPARAIDSMILLNAASHGDNVTMLDLFHRFHLRNID